MNNPWKTLAPAALSLMLVACAPIGPAPTTTSYPDRPTNSPSAPVPERKRSPAPVEPRPVEPAPAIVPDRTDPSAQESPVAGLLARGWQYQNGGEYDRALAVAERAQGIEPRNPEAYLLMASAQFSMQRADAAEQLARRGLSLSRAGTAVHRRLQALLGQIAALR